MRSIMWLNSVQSQFGGLEKRVPIAFTCRICGTELTDFLCEVDPAALDHTIGGAMVKPGRYVRTPVLMSREHLCRIIKFLNSQGDDIVVQPADFLLNIADLRHQMHARANFGCCGYQGDAEANALCSNGHPIGTIHSDCWHPSVARLIGKAVECVVV